MKSEADVSARIAETVLNMMVWVPDSWGLFWLSAALHLVFYFGVMPHLFGAIVGKIVGHFYPPSP